MTKYPSLNGLRAVSIMVVILGHLALVPHRIIINDGEFGVNIFFVISGFLITSLLIREEERMGYISLKNFYIRRVLRIFPAYYFLLFIYFILTLFDVIKISNISWFTSLTYLKSFKWSDDWWTAHAWSLSVEELFYLLWPLMFRKAGANKIKILIAIVIVCPLFRIIGVIMNEPVLISLYSPFQHMDAIAMGCIAAIYQNKINDTLLINKKIIPLSLLIWLGTYIIVPISAKYNLYIYAIGVAIGGSMGIITNIAIAVLILYLVFLAENTIGFKILNSKIMNQIGILSYSIYLWQQIFTSDLPIGRSFFPFNLILIAIASLISYYLIEKPFLKLKDKFVIKY